MSSVEEVKLISPVRDDRRASRHLVFTHYIDGYRSFDDFEEAVEEFELDNPHHPLTKVLNVLKRSESDLQRGDIVQLLPDTFKNSDGFGKEIQFYNGRRFRNDWLVYYDGTNLKPLPAEIVDYGHIPSSFTVPDQFPTGYWLHAIDYHSQRESLDPSLIKFIEQTGPQVGKLSFRERIGMCNEDIYPYWRVIIDRSNEKTTYSETCSCGDEKNCECEEFYVIGSIDEFSTLYDGSEKILRLIREAAHESVFAGEENYDIGATPPGKTVYVIATTIISASGDGETITVHYTDGTTGTERYNERR